MSSAVLVATAVTAGSGFRHDLVLRRPDFFQVSISPKGDWLVAVAAKGKIWGVLAQHVESGRKELVYASEYSIRRVEWIGGRTIYVEHWRGQRRTGSAVRLSLENDRVMGDETHITTSGFLVHPLPLVDEVVLWSRRSGGYSRVFRGPIHALGGGARWRKDGEGSSGKLEQRARLEAPVIQWVTDRSGVVRAALEIDPDDEEKPALRYRAGADDPWRVVWRATSRWDVIFPLAMTRDGLRLIVVAYGSLDTRGLFEFDPQSGKLGRAIFQRSDVDMTDAIFDYDQTEIIAAVYEEDGLQKFYYLNDFRDKYLKGADDIAPGEALSVTSSSLDHRYLSILADSARNPGTFYIWDNAAGKGTKICDVISGISADRLSDFETIDVVSADGTRLEAFFARPIEFDGDRPPLLVMPHGGPLGVRDSRSFDAIAQYVLLGGIAVLKVNYRGSYGYGRAFLEAGKREWAGGIEEDIDAALRTTIERGLVDPDRICIAGGSYGGYSALMSVILHPDRYRCAASLNGVTDVPLLFLSSMASTDENHREAMAEIIGDPETDFDRLVAISPVYRVPELQVPVLVAYGSKDERVEPEHAYRLRAMLRLYEKPYEWLELRESGHSPSTSDYRLYGSRLRRFLDIHLRPGSSPRRR